MLMKFSMANPSGKARAIANAIALLGRCMGGVTDQCNRPAIIRPLEVGLMLYGLRQDTCSVLAGFLTDPLQIGLVTTDEINESVWCDAAWGVKQCCLDPDLFKRDPSRAETEWFERGLKYPKIAMVMAAYSVWDIRTVPKKGKEKSKVIEHAKQWYQIALQHHGAFHPVVAQLCYAIEEKA